MGPTERRSYRRPGHNEIAPAQTIIPTPFKFSAYEDAQIQLSYESLIVALLNTYRIGLETKRGGQTLKLWPSTTVNLLLIGSFLFRFRH